MNLASIRVITSDVLGLVTFYEHVIEAKATWSTPEFAEIVTVAGTLAIASTRTLKPFGGDIARPADNHTVIIEFRVADVDAAYERLRPLGSGADDDAPGQPVRLVARPGRQSRQPLHSRYRRRHHQTGPLI